MTDFPDGDGRPDCPKCRGRGVYDFKPEGALVPGVLTCECVLDRDIKSNMERGWRGLSSAKPAESTWLGDFISKDLWLTAETRTLRRHLHKAAYSMGPYWRFQVSTDADLMDAWLSHIGPSDLYDPDVSLLRQRSEQVSNRFPALVDLVEPPSLLVLCVSVKAARNSAMPEVLMEALQHRAHISKPTWIVDLPDKRLGPTHIAYSDGVGYFLDKWDHYDLEAEPSDSGYDLPEVSTITTGRKTKTGARPVGMSDSAWARLQMEGTK